MNKILYSLISFFSFFFVASAAFDENDIIPTSWTALNSGETGTDLLDAILIWIKDSLFALMAVIAIGVFLFIWGKLVIARGNPEEFQKALKMFIYAAVWIFIVAFAWAAVRLVAGINL